MYRVRLNSDREEGPLTTAQVAEALHTRRLNPETLVQAEGQREWRPLSSLPEFATAVRQFSEMGAILNAPRPSRLAQVSLVLGIVAWLSLVVASLTGFKAGQRMAEIQRVNASNLAERRAARRTERKAERAVAPKPGEPKPPANPPNTAPVPGSPPNNPSGPAMPRALMITTGVASAMALGSMLGALVCGTAALVRMRRPGHRLTGQGYAWGGLGCAAGMVLAISIGALEAYRRIPVGEVRRYAAYEGRMRALSELHRHIAKADGTLPSAERWCDTLKLGLPADSKALGTPKEGCRFGYNSRLEGRRLKELPRDVVVLFELRKPGWNVAGGADAIRRPGDLAERVVVLCADGKPRLIPAMEVDAVQWEP